MPTKLETSDTVQLRPDGRQVPNLRMVYDNQRGWEFQVMCEVVLTDAEAAGVNEGITQRSPEALDRIKNVIVGRIDQGATDTFRQIVADAFDDNIGRMDKSKK